MPNKWTPPKLTKIEGIDPFKIIKSLAKIGIYKEKILESFTFIGILFFFIFPKSCN